MPTHLCYTGKKCCSVGAGRIYHREHPALCCLCFVTENPSLSYAGSLPSHYSVSHHSLGQTPLFLEKPIPLNYVSCCCCCSLHQSYLPKVETVGGQSAKSLLFLLYVVCPSGVPPEMLDLQPSRISSQHAGIVVPLFLKSTQEKKANVQVDISFPSRLEC